MLNGIDVSQWQVQTPSLTGLSFAFARATYGTRPDERYTQHTAAFRKAGLVSGAYHFGLGSRWDLGRGLDGQSVSAQVKAFLDVAHDADLLILDLENDPNGAMTQAAARSFIARVQLNGRRIGLYHSRSAFPDLGQDYNWIAQWGTGPPVGLDWAFWQYQGITIDKDGYNGNLASLRSLAGLPPPSVTNDLIIGATLTFSGPTMVYARMTSTGYIGTRKLYGVSGLAVVVNELLVPRDPVKLTGGSFWRLTTGAAAGWLVSTSDKTITVTGGHL